MGYLKTKGIVIKEVNTGEADKILTVFSKSNGRISGFAKGARRPKNRLSAGTQFLCYSDFVLFRGRDMYNITSCDVIEPFYNIRNDVVRLTYSAHIVELINDVLQENQASSKLLQLFLNTLHFLSDSDKSPELLTRIFEMRLMSLLGYAPHVRSCIVCGSEDFTRAAFSFKKCGLICGECRSHDEYALDILPGTARALNHIIHSKIDSLFAFNLSDEVLNELGKINKRYLRDRLERDYTKLDFLKTLELK